MSKRYMDFVPSKSTKKSVGGGVAKKTAVKTVVAKKPVSKANVPKKPATRVAKPEPKAIREEVVYQEDVISTDADTFSLKQEPKYGVIEDFRPKFVKTEVPKRPLSKGHFTSKRSDLAEAKATKIATRKIIRPVEKPVEKSEKTEVDKAKMPIPKSPFINQAKVPKRPLSKNVYEKKIEPTNEPATGPVTIISKPEKDAKARMIAAWIIAAVLGVIAGTVAFLLLPR